MSQLGDGTVTFTITAFPRPATRPAKQDRPGRAAVTRSPAANCALAS